MTGFITERTVRTVLELLSNMIQDHPSRETVLYQESFREMQAAIERTVLNL